MSGANVYAGRCFCGAVELTVTGEPLTMGYCHCADCRAWFASPVNAFTIWPPEAVRVTKGAENVGSYRKTETSVRKWCTACGGHLLSEHPTWGVTDVAAAVLPDLPFEAALHVNYASTALPMRDGLPKHKDFPADMGGSGVLLPERPATARLADDPGQPADGHGRGAGGSMGKVRFFLRQPRVREALGRANSLAERLRLREAVGKVPPLVREWRLPERLGGLYDSSLKPHIERLGRPKHPDTIADLERLVARGTKLERAPEDGDAEQWRSEALAWLTAGEALLRDRLPDEYRKLAAFAARLALDADQGRLRQAVSRRLEVLTDLGRGRGTRPPAG